MRRRFRQYARYFFVTLFLLLCGLIGFSQTGLFKTRVRSAIMGYGNKNLNGRLQIGTIHGNLLSHFAIADIQLTSQNDTVIRVERLEVTFSLFRLFHKELQVRVIGLKKPFICLKQMPDSSWNLEHLLIRNTPPEPKSPKKINWRFQFENVRINQGGLEIVPLARLSILPERIQDIDTNLSCAIRQDTIQTTVKKFSCQAFRPDLAMHELTFNLFIEKKQLWVRNLKLVTPGSSLSGQGQVNLAFPEACSLSLVARPIDCSEIQSLIPDLPLAIPVNLDLDAMNVSDTLKLAVAVSMQEQSVQLKGSATDFPAHPHFDVTAEINQIQLSEWLDDPELDYLLNGRARLLGEGKNSATMSATLQADFSQCQVLARPVQRAALSVDYRPDSLSGLANIVGVFGSLSLDARLLDWNGNQKFDLSASGQQINLAPLLRMDSLKSCINFSLNANGQGIQLKKMTAWTELRLFESKVLQVPLDTLFSGGKVKNGTYFIDSFYVHSAPVKIHLNGMVKSDLSYDLNFNSQFSGLDWLKSLAAVNSISGHGSLTGHVYGKIDSMIADSKLNFNDLHYNTIAVDSLTGNFYSIYTADSLNGILQAHLKKMSLSDLSVDLVNVQSIINKNKLHLFTDFKQSKELSGNFEAFFCSDSVSQLDIPSMTVSIKNNQWTNDDDSIQILLTPDQLVIKNFYLRSGNQSIHAQGTLTKKGTEDLDVKISQLKVEPFFSLAGLPIPIRGVLAMDTHLGGTLARPLIRSELTLENGRIKELDFNNLRVHLDYSDEQLNWILTLQHSKLSDLEIMGFLPINLSLLAARDRLNYQKPLMVTITMDTLDLKVLEAFSDQVKVMGGKVFGNLKVADTLKKARPSGEFKIMKGSFRIPPLGIHYKDIEAVVTVDSSQFLLRNFAAKSDRGTLIASGYLNFDQDVLKGKFQSTYLNLVADQFSLVNNKNYEVIIGSNMQLAGQAHAPQFNGSIRVLRSRFYLPAFMQSGSHNKIEMAQPLLLQMSQDTLTETPLLTRISFPDFLNNLSGSAKIEIPRNTWLKSPEINVEIAGELTAVKQPGSLFELFGTIRILRGTYHIYGKRFTVQKGNFAFEGGSRYNPDIELEASHVFRVADNEKKVLTLLVTGKASSPNLKFTLDEAEITEGNAVAYLILGRSLDDLTLNQRSALSQQTHFNPTNAASSIVTGLIADQVSKTIANKLKLDVIEFKGEENWRQATFVVGKYLTNDLFFSYLKEFSTIQSNEIVPDEITLEYEINRKLFLQLTKGSEKNTGFDLIVKLQK